MTPFRVGDRVAVYDDGHRQIGVVGQIGDDFGSVHIRVDGVKTQQCESWSFGWFHPKQCRRLKKKERRRIWLNPKYPDVPRDEVYSSSKEYPGFIEFIEVKRKRESE